MRGLTSTPPIARPILPVHLQERCFLSPIVCAHALHRYRDTPYTLRYLDTEQCVQCVMAAGEREQGAGT